MTLHALEMQIDRLSQPDKARVLGRLALDLTHRWPGIEKTAGVQGGDACIVRTRIPIWTLESYRRL
ncbi:MAG: hypothetical protein H7Z42_08690 [Roseiflexaceae bacterium]|nr:hypothetical protein [Roseiflexaceae bacterium]